MSGTRTHRQNIRGNAQRACAPIARGGNSADYLSTDYIDVLKVEARQRPRSRRPISLPRFSWDKEDENEQKK